jgi:hypothetical protein
MLLAALMVCVFSGGALSTPISSEADLTRVIAQLQPQDTRFQAFLDLIQFDGFREPGNVVALNGMVGGDEHQLEQMRSQAIAAVDKCPDLDGVIAAAIRYLEEPRRRLAMISALIKFAGRDMHPIGSVFFLSDNPRLDALKDKARGAANQAASVKTVTEALTNADLTLRKWAVEKFGNPLNSAEEWTPLLPQIETIGSGSDSDLRGAAIGPLQRFPGTEKFLDKRYATEKSAFLLMNLLHGRGIWGEEFDRKFQARLTELLDDPEESVRGEGLDFIGCNDGWADMYKVSFERKIFNQVIAATKSNSAKERFEAVFALNYIRHLDPNASRQTFLLLVKDPDENVRWRLGFCLADQQNQPDVKRALDALLKDKAHRVILETIYALGPEKYTAQLQELAHGQDAQVSEEAASQLKWTAERNLAEEKDQSAKAPWR